MQDNTAYVSTSRWIRSGLFISYQGVTASDMPNSLVYTFHFNFKENTVNLVKQATLHCDTWMLRVTYMAIMTSCYLVLFSE